MTEISEKDRNHAKLIRDDVATGVFPFAQLMLHERKLLCDALDVYAAALPHLSAAPEGKNWTTPTDNSLSVTAGDRRAEDADPHSLRNALVAQIEVTTRLARLLGFPDRDIADFTAQGRAALTKARLTAPETQLPREPNPSLASRPISGEREKIARPVEFDRIRALLVRYAARLQDKTDEPPGQFLIAHALLQAVEMLDLLTAPSAVMDEDRRDSGAQ